MLAFCATSRFWPEADISRRPDRYLTYSDMLIEGSPMNSITAVPVDRSVAIPVKR
jgi:CreA protein